jgi:hypothetical protein
MMYSHRNLAYLLVALGGLPACSSDTSGEGEIASAETNSQALTAVNVVAGFESLSAWSATSAARTLTTDHVEGASALAVSNIKSYTELVSDVTSGPGSVGAAVTLRIKPPAGHAQASWKGLVQLYVDSPSRGLHSAYVGQAELNGLTAGAYGTVSISVPSNIRTALSTGSIADVRYQLTLSVPLPGPYLLDALELGAPISDPTPTPTPKAYTGGRDVAVLWKPIQWSRQTSRYDVYRNGQLIGAAPPSLYLTGNSAATYIDPSVTDGQSYTYEVQAVASDGARAARSTAVSITHSTVGTPVPTITIDTDGFSHTLPYLQLGKAYLETWYPKIANLLAYPDYAPPANLTLLARDPDECGGASGWIDGTPDTVHICADPNIGSSDDVGLFVHEATHLMQAYGGPQLAGAGESIATWAGHLAIGRDNPAPGPFFSFFDDYEYGAYFYDWISRTYSKPEFIADLNVVCHEGTYTDAWMQQYTGRTIGQLFGEMTGATFTSSGPLKKAANRYAYPLDSNPNDKILTPGSRLVLVDNPDPNASYFFQGPMAALPGPGPLRWAKDICIQEDAQHYVVIDYCSSVAPTQWRYLAGIHAFRNEATGRCLQPQNGSSALGTPLVTATCTGSAAQEWEPLPL